MSRCRSTVSLERLSCTPFPRPSASPSQVPSRRSSEYRDANRLRASELQRQHQLQQALNHQVSEHRKTLESLKSQELQLDKSVISRWKAQERELRAQQTRKRMEKIETRKQLEKQHQSSALRRSFEVEKELEVDRNRVKDQFRLHKKEIERAKADKARVKSLLQAVISSNSQAASAKLSAMRKELEEDLRFQQNSQKKLEEMELQRGSPELKASIADIRGSFELKRKVLQRKQQSEYREKLDKQVAEKRRRGWQEWREAQVTHSTLF